MTRRSSAAVADVVQFPNSLDAERAVLGAILLHSDVLTRIEDTLEASDFYRRAHQQIFAAMLGLATAGRPVEFVTLTNALAGLGELDEVGGPAYLSALVDGLPRGTNITHYAQIVREKRQLREAMRIGTRVVADAAQGETSAADLTAQAAEQLADLGSQALTGQPVSLRDLASAGLDVIEHTYATKGIVTGLPTGFAVLDELTAGLQPQDLILIAARTSVGKTSFALNVARRASEQTPVLVCSLEMSRQQLWQRMLACEARVDSHALRTGYLTDADFTRIGHASAVLADLPIWIDDASGLTVRQVRARARQLRATHGLGLVVIDYIQLMRGTVRMETRTQEIGAMSQGLKALAKDLAIPVVALSQLSRRAVEIVPGRATRRPELSDLAESGRLEQDADVVLLLHQPVAKKAKAGEPPPETPPAEIIVAKQRNGPAGADVIVQVWFRKAESRFESASVV